MNVVLVHCKCWCDALQLGYLDHVADAFKKFNYTVGDDFSDWDVLWSYEYPFNKYYSQLASLQPHQKVCVYQRLGFDRLLQLFKYLVLQILLIFIGSVIK